MMLKSRKLLDWETVVDESAVLWIEPIQFLKYVWYKQPHDKGYVFVSTKDGERWEDHSIELGVDYVWKVPEDKDVYFCPTVFTKPERKAKYALPSIYLHADLDEIHPDDAVIEPTTAWETSRGRYQCLWQMTKAVGIENFERINKALTYACGADTGGWSITKVLRVPGTYNHKRGAVERVELMWEGGHEYSPRVVYDEVRDVIEIQRNYRADRLAGKLDIPDVPWESLYTRYRKKVGARARVLLKTKTARGDRSARLWELESLLVKAGLPLEEILVLVRGTAWNKYRGQRREIVQLWTEVNKASAIHLGKVEHADSNGRSRHLKRGEDGNVLPVNEDKDEAADKKPGLIRYRKFLAEPIETPGWTVKGVWGDKAHGLVCAPPKCYKSITVMDLAVSVASGTPFLGKFAIPNVGPVIMIQEEVSSKEMRYRLSKIAMAKKLYYDVQPNSKSSTFSFRGPDDLDIYFRNGAGTNLKDLEDRALIENWIKEIRPSMVILDPLYLMCGGADESDYAAMMPVLDWLLKIKLAYETGIIIVHHYNKPRVDENRAPGHRMSGTGAFFRWFESALYLERKGRYTVEMTAEHRGHPMLEGVRLDFDLDDGYRVDVDMKTSVEASSLRSEVLELVTAEPGITVTELMAQTDVKRERLLRTCAALNLNVRAGRADGSRGRPSQRVFLPVSK